MYTSNGATLWAGAGASNCLTGLMVHLGVPDDTLWNGLLSLDELVAELGDPFCDMPTFDLSG